MIGFFFIFFIVLVTKRCCKACREGSNYQLLRLRSIITEKDITVLTINVFLGVELHAGGKLYYTR